MKGYMSHFDFHDTSLLICSKYDTYTFKRIKAEGLVLPSVFWRSGLIGSYHWIISPEFQLQRAYPHRTESCYHIIVEDFMS